MSSFMPYSHGTCLLLAYLLCPITASKNQLSDNLKTVTIFCFYVLQYNSNSQEKFPFFRINFSIFKKEARAYLTGLSLSKWLFKSSDRDCHFLEHFRC